jgi:hypothetical protein
VIAACTNAKVEHQTLLYASSPTRAVQQLVSQTLRDGYQRINTKLTVVDRSRNIPQFLTVLSEHDAHLPYIIALISQDQLLRGQTSKVIIYSPTPEYTRLVADVLRSIQATVLPAGLQGIHVMAKDAREPELQERWLAFIRSPGPAVLFGVDAPFERLRNDLITTVIQIGVPPNPIYYFYRIKVLRDAETPVGIGDRRADVVMLEWEKALQGWMGQETNFSTQVPGSLMAHVSESLGRRSLASLCVPEDMPVVRSPPQVGTDSAGDVRAPGDVGAATLNVNPNRALEAELEVEPIPAPAPTSSRDPRLEPLITGIHPSVPPVASRTHATKVANELHQALAGIPRERIREAVVSLVEHYVRMGVEHGVFAIPDIRRATLTGWRSWGRALATSKDGRMEKGVYIPERFVNDVVKETKAKLRGGRRSEWAMKHREGLHDFEKEGSPTPRKLGSLNKDTSGVGGVGLSSILRNDRGA